MKSRLQEQSHQLEELKQTIKLLGNVIDNKELTSDEAVGLLKVVTDYTYALDVLDQYDHQVLEISGTTAEELFQIRQGNNYKNLEPYFSMAFNRLGLITQSELEKILSSI